VISILFCFSSDDLKIAQAYHYDKFINKKQPNQYKVTSSSKNAWWEMELLLNHVFVSNF
jgi:hypothetical protein